MARSHCARRVGFMLIAILPPCAAFAAVTACSSAQDGDASPSTLDAAPDGTGSTQPVRDGATTDAGADSRPVQDGTAAGACDQAAPFGTPALVDGIATDADEDDAHLSADEKTIWFARRPADRSAAFDIARASRATTAMPFSNELPVTEANGPLDDRSPNVDVSGLYYVRATSTDALSDDDFHFGAHMSSGAFGTTFRANKLSSDYVDTDLFIDANERFYFASSRPAGGVLRLFAIQWTNGQYGPQVELAIPVGVDEPLRFPVATANGARIFFARPRSAGSTSHAIWTATPTSPNIYQSPSLVTELDEAATSQWPTWITADGCALYFTSDRAAAVGGRNVWVARKPK